MRLVTDHLIERLFKPKRLAAILSSLSARRAQKAESVSSRLMVLATLRLWDMQDPSAKVDVLNFNAFQRVRTTS